MVSDAAVLNPADGEETGFFEWSGGVEDHIFCCRVNFGAEHSVALIEGGLKPHVFAAQLRERQAGLRVCFFLYAAV